MALYSTDKKLNIMYDALAQWKSVEIVGAVPDMQNYDPDIGSFMPDYTLTPLTLKFLCSTSGQAENSATSVNAKLTNMHFYEVIAGVTTEITADNKNYTVTTTGDDAGTIVIKKNGSTISNTTIRFHAEYVDATSGRTYRYDMDYRLKCIDGQAGVPILNVDAPRSYGWNPLRDGSTFTINAKCMLGKVDVTSKCKIFFYRKLDTGALQPVGTIDGTDWEVTALTDTSLTINLDLIGEGMTYVVKFSYDSGGKPADTPNDAYGVKSTVIRRVIPKLIVDYKGVPEQVPEGTDYVCPVPFVLDTKGLITDYRGILNFSWYTAPKGSDKLTLAATGEKPSIPYTDGMTIQMNVEDKGPLKAVVDANGKYITANGKYITVR